LGGYGVSRSEFRVPIVLELVVELELGCWVSGKRVQGSEFRVQETTAFHRVRARDLNPSLASLRLNVLRTGNLRDSRRLSLVAVVGVGNEREADSRSLV